MKTNIKRALVFSLTVLGGLIVTAGSALAAGRWG